MINPKMRIETPLGSRRRISFREKRKKTLLKSKDEAPLESKD